MSSVFEKRLRAAGWVFASPAVAPVEPAREISAEELAAEMKVFEPFTVWGPRETGDLFEGLEPRMNANER